MEVNIIQKADFGPKGPFARLDAEYVWKSWWDVEKVVRGIDGWPLIELVSEYNGPTLMMVSAVKTQSSGTLTLTPLIQQMVLPMQTTFFTGTVLHEQSINYGKAICSFPTCVRIGEPSVWSVRFARELWQARGLASYATKN